MPRAAPRSAPSKATRIRSGAPRSAPTASGSSPAPRTTRRGCGIGERRRARLPRRPFVSAAFSPDGTRVVTTSLDNTARLWDATSGAALVTLDGHTRNVYSAGFSPDGTCVVTASEDESARRWDSKTGAPLATLEGHASSVLSARFSPDGQRVVTASGDRTARLWQVWPLLSDDTAAYTSIAAMGALTSEERSRAFLTAAAVGAAKTTPEPDRHRRLAEGFERTAGAGRDLDGRCSITRSRCASSRSKAAKTRHGSPACGAARSPACCRRRPPSASPTKRWIGSPQRRVSLEGGPGYPNRANPVAGTGSEIRIMPDRVAVLALLLLQSCA